eukprot:TRINITY_DN932_c5_g1_i1.p1 TRINITY_DN932_c5_g1~~TRINITY_DN932_c5_g1_i1.p1  ORF type:complete len:405 (+),score=84.16 TRINITY_DN932_c5_g1_i1:458-1672(+)
MAGRDGDMASASQAGPPRRDPYVVLGVERSASEDQIRSAYKKLALKFHPDKNANNPEAADKFREVAYSYSILSDPEKRRQYDSQGFEGVDIDGEDSLDLSNLGMVNTAVVALFSKLGVHIKTSISTSVLEEAMNGTVTIKPLPVGRVVSGKVERMTAHFFGCTITEDQARGGVAVRVVSGPTSKFKLLYFEQESSGGYNLVMQENSVRTNKGTVAGFYFFGYPVFRLDPTVSTLEIAKDPEAALFKKLENMQPCEMKELRGGTHIFAVYGDNFFKSTPYTIEAKVLEEGNDFVHKMELQEIEAKLLTKREELRKFEVVYKEAMARFLEADARLKNEKSEVDLLLAERNRVQEQFTSVGKGPNPPPPTRGGSTFQSFWGMPSMSTAATPSTPHMPVTGGDPAKAP